MARDSSKTASAGIYITPRATIAVQARMRGNEVEVHARGAVETPPDAIVNGEIADPVRVGQAIRHLWRRTGLDARSVVVALPAGSCSMRALRLPHVPERERSALVRGELEQAQVIPHGGGGFDYLWVGQAAPAGSTPQADVYAYYTNSAAVENVRRAVQAAGLRLDAAEPASLSVMRGCLAARQQGEPVALLCPSETHTDLCIHDGTRVRQLRRIPAGWADLSVAPVEGTRDLLPDPTIWDAHAPPRSAAASQTPLGEAVEPEGEGDVSVYTHLPKVWPSGPRPDEEKQDEPEEEPTLVGMARSQDAVKQDFLVSEVGRTLAFYAREHPEETHPRSLLILAPSAVARRFEAALADTQTIPVAVWDPLAALDLPRPIVPPSWEDGDGYLEATGAALGVQAASARVPCLNLARREAAAVARERAPHTLRAGMAGSTLWLAMALGAWLTLWVLQARAVDETARLKAEIARIEAERAPALRYFELSQAARAAAAASQVPGASVLGRIAASTTPGVGLTSTRVAQDGRILIEGRAIGTTHVRRFALALGRGSAVKHPAIEQMKRDNTGQLTFRIGGWWREPMPPAAKEPSR